MKTRIAAAFAAMGMAHALAAPQAAAPIGGPQYTANALVNSADFAAGALSPNTIVTLFGDNLSFSTAKLLSYEIQNDTLPLELPLTGVHVYVGGIIANIYYVSPTQINFLIPVEMPPIATTFQVVRDGYAGPQLPLTLVPVAPAMYMLDSERVVAQLVDGSIIRTDNPAHPGDIVILYVTGLGQTVPPLRNGEIPQSAQPIVDESQLQVLLDGTAVPAANLLYAGTAPKYCGLYQINLRLPDDVGPDPQIRIGMGSQMSQKNVRLIVLPAQ